MRLPILSLVLSSCLLAGEPADPPAPEDPHAALLKRLEQMEKRIQLLEQSVVAKDARIAELEKKLAEPPPPPAREHALPRPDVFEGVPGFRMELTPDQLREIERRMDEFMRGNLEVEDPFEAPNDMDREIAELMERFRNQGRIVRPPAPKPRLGVRLADVSEEMNERYRNKAIRGAFVVEIIPGTPAERAGLREGDCILSINEQPVRDFRDFTAKLHETPAGKVKLVVMRLGEELALEPELAAAEAPPAFEREGFREDERGWLRRGEDREGRADREGREVAEIRSGALELNDTLARAMGLNERERAKIREVLARHAKALAGEYEAALAGRGPGRRALSDAELHRMAERHAQLAEAELKGTLDEEQLGIWRRYRERHGHELSIIRRMAPPAEEGENLNF